MLSSFVASLYLLSSRVFRVVLGVAEGVFEGVWMGLLPESVCDAISEKSYGDGRLYTNAKHLDSGLHFWEDLAIRTYFKPGSQVLVGSAGGGREMIALARAGFGTAGFECSRAMVEEGRRGLAARGINARLDWAPPSVAPKMGGVFDAVIVGWNGYTYIAPRARRLSFLRDLKEQAKPGAPVLVSMAIRREPARLPGIAARVANAMRLCTFRPRVFEPGDGFPGRPKHHFTPRQMKQELQDAGLAVKRFYIWGDYGAVVAEVPASGGVEVAR